MNWLNYHHLIYFKHIAELGSIAKASKKLLVGQSALSSQLKKLEESLGVNLFERKNRSLVLTDAGKSVLDYAIQIFDIGNELQQTLKQGSLARRAYLKVGAVHAIPKHLVSNIVDFAHKQTGCMLSILEGKAEYLLRELSAFKLDVLIADQSLAYYKGGKLYSKKIIRDPVYAYASAEYLSYKENFPQSLNKASVILPTHDNRLALDLEHFFATHSISPDTIAETQDLMLQKILAIKGDGIVFLPQFAALEYVKEKKLVEIGRLKEVYAEYYLYYTKRMIENPAVDLLVHQDYKKIKLES